VDDGAMTPHARPADLALLVRRIGFWAGPALALVLYVVLPAGETVAEGTLSPAGLSTLAMTSRRS
jgi:hypothetical protein